jgi:small-conductance mechanosensitive channel
MNEFLQSVPYIEVIETLVFVGIALALRQIAIRAILRNAAKAELRRRWIVNIRNLTVFVILLILLAIWSESITGYVTALLAFAVAAVIATKELIQCLLGGVLRTVTNTYSVGDRIEIGPHRGDVIDITALATTLLEVGPGKTSHLRTGRTVIIPNSKLTDTYVVNESNMKQYVVHYFSVPLSSKDDWKMAKRTLQQAAEEECRSFLDEVRAHMEELERKHGLKGLPLRPRVLIEIPQSDKVNLLVRVPTPVGAQGRIEQAVLKRYLETRSSIEPVAPAVSTPPPAADGGYAGTDS